MIFFKFFCQERKKILSKTMNAFLKVFPKVHFIIFYQKQVLRPNSIHQLQQSQNNNNNKLKKKIDKSDSESRTKNDFKVSSLLLEAVVNQNNFKFFSITSSSSTILKKTSDLCKKMCKNVWLRLASSTFTVTSSRRKSFHFFRSSKSTNMLDRSSPLEKDRRRLDKSSLVFF